MVKLSILIASLEKRHRELEALEFELQLQADTVGLKIEILKEVDNGERITGEKRNTLMKRATGEYVAYFDDDDWPSLVYMRTLKEGIEKGMDCCSLRGIITEDGLNAQIFEHSIRYTAWATNDEGEIKYERMPNHLNCIKRSITEQVIFPELNHGEDHKWSTKLFELGLIKTEYYSSNVIYQYKYQSKK